MTPSRFIHSIRPLAQSAKRHIRAGMDALLRPRTERQLADQARQPNNSNTRTGKPKRLAVSEAPARSLQNTQAHRRERFINMSLARRVPTESTKGPVSHLDFQELDQFQAPESHALIEGFKQAFNACLSKDRPQLNSSGDVTPGSQNWCDAVASRIATGDDIEELVSDLLEQYRAADGQNDQFVLWLEHKQEQVQNDVQFWWGEAQSHATAMRRAGYPF